MDAYRGYQLFLMFANEWLYVFGFAMHIQPFKAIQPIGKTDIYNVLPTGVFTEFNLKHKTK